MYYSTNVYDSTNVLQSCMTTICYGAKVKAVGKNRAMHLLCMGCLCNGDLLVECNGHLWSAFICVVASHMHMSVGHAKAKNQCGELALHASHSSCKNHEGLAREINGRWT